MANFRMSRSNQQGGARGRGRSPQTTTNQEFEKLINGVVRRLAKEILDMDISEEQAGSVARGVRDGVRKLDRRGRLEDLEGRRGLMLQVPFLLPVTFYDDEVQVNIEEFDLPSEIENTLDEWQEGIVDLYVVSKDGAGDFYKVQNNGQIEINLHLGDLDDDYDDY